MLLFQVVLVLFHKYPIALMLCLKQINGFGLRNIGCYNSGIYFSAFRLLVWCLYYQTNLSCERTAETEGKFVHLTTYPLHILQHFGIAWSVYQYISRNENIILYNIKVAIACFESCRSFSLCTDIIFAICCCFKNRYQRKNSYSEL